MGIAALAAVPLLALGGTAMADTPTATATATGSATATGTATTTTTPTTPTIIDLQAGGGETGYSVDLYLPNTATVLTNTVVRWTMPWAEPHTVTFGNPGAADPTALPNPFPTGPVPYDGTGYITSGLIGKGYIPGPPGTPQGPFSFEVQFTKAGSYDFFCAIHPNMTGTITVVDSGTVSTQAALTAAGQSTYATELAAIKAVRAGISNTPTTTTNADGSKTYGLDVGGETQNGQVMQFVPQAVNVNVGDSVTWTSAVHEPHTITFGPPPAGDPLTAPPVIPAAFDGSGPANSALIGIGYPAQTFTLKFTKAGSYNYICLLHAAQGMVGTVNVAAQSVPPTTGPTVAPTKAPPGPPNTGSGSSSSASTLWLVAGLAGALLIISGSATLAMRRR